MFRKDTGEYISKTHGMTNTRFWTIYRGIIQRCNDTNSIGYKRYGGRGVKCLWVTFEDFKNDMYQSYQDGLTIDRLDNDGDYCKENCRWSTPRQQANNRSSNYMITHSGKTQSMADWSRELDMGYTLIKKRVLRGWPDDRVLTEPRNDKFRNSITRTLQQS